jgi:lysophospholipase L1-like esterase
MTSRHWVDTWVSTPQPTEPDNLPPPFARGDVVLADSTLRQTVRASVGGQHIRLCLTNAYAGSALAIAAVSVALPPDGQAGVSAIQPGTARQVTFHGRPSVVVPAGGLVESDPLEFDVAPRSNLTVTMYLTDGLASHDVTSHPGSRTTSYLLAGNHVADVDLPGATPIDHWYFLSGLRVPARATTAVAVVIGDSLTDGRGSTTNLNNRWPDQLLDRLQSQPDTKDIAILNHAVGGSRLLDDGQGPDTLDRLARDVLARNALHWLIVFKGVNDIGTAAATEAAQRQTAADLIQAYDKIITSVHKHGIRVYGATLPPFGGHPDYDDPLGYRGMARQVVNEWIRTSGRFDSVVDADLAVRDPRDPRQLLPTFDDGDHLHLNPTGYKVLADTIPAHLFRTPGEVAPPRWENPGLEERG